MTKRAAIYARFSTERQDERSVADQVRLCRERADALGFAVVLTKADEGVSGATPVQVRPGSSALLAAAMAGQFEVLIMEGLERLSRDLVDSETICRRLEHRGIRIVGVGDGYDSASGESRELLRGVRGLFNQSYLRDASKKTHRGLVGQVARGFHAGGMSYGYRSAAVDMNERGEAAGFRLEIVPDQAEVVRWIFDRYADAWSCQRIAADLNARAVPGPGRKRTRASTWSVSALYGSPAKGSGILNNSLYNGEYVWNRSRWIKNPDTGQRERQMRPESEWQRVARDDLRIVAGR